MRSRMRNLDDNLWGIWNGYEAMRRLLYGYEVRIWDLIMKRLFTWHRVMWRWFRPCYLRVVTDLLRLYLVPYTRTCPHLVLQNLMAEERLQTFPYPIPSTYMENLIWLIHSNFLIQWNPFIGTTVGTDRSGPIRWVVLLEGLKSH